MGTQRSTVTVTGHADTERLDGVIAAGTVDTGPSSSTDFYATSCLYAGARALSVFYDEMSASLFYCLRDCLVSSLQQKVIPAANTSIPSSVILLYVSSHSSLFMLKPQSESIPHISCLIGRMLNCVCTNYI